MPATTFAPSSLVAQGGSTPSVRPVKAKKKQAPAPAAMPVQPSAPVPNMYLGAPAQPMGGL